MKNIWPIIGGIVALFILWKLWQGFTAAGGVSGLLGAVTGSGAGSTPPASAYMGGPAASTPYVPPGNAGSSSAPPTPTGVWGGNPVMGPSSGSLSSSQPWPTLWGGNPPMTPPIGVVPISVGPSAPWRIQPLAANTY